MARTLDESVGLLLSAAGGLARVGLPPGALAVGTVERASREGLRVQCGGLSLGPGRIWINEALLEGYSPKLTGTLTGSCPDGGTTTPVAADQLTRGEFGLAEGDRVVLLTQDEQDYYLICKVVRP